MMIVIMTNNSDDNGDNSYSDYRPVGTIVDELVMPKMIWYWWRALTSELIVEEDNEREIGSLMMMMVMMVIL